MRQAGPAAGEGAQAAGGEGGEQPAAAVTSIVGRLGGLGKHSCSMAFLDYCLHVYSMYSCKLVYDMGWDRHKYTGFCGHIAKSYNFVLV